MAKDGVTLRILPGRVYPRLSIWALNKLMFPYIREAEGVLKQTFREYYADRCSHKSSNAYHHQKLGG